MRRSVLFLALFLAALAAGPAAAAPVVGGQFRLWSFSDDETMRDVLAYYAPGPFHVQLEYWDFEFGEDQFRPEVGLHFFDKRRSAYTVQWRHELGAERFWFDTAQPFGGRWVGRASVSPIVTDDEVLTVLQAGVDAYWASYSFASVDVIRDPRQEGLWVVPLRARFANESNNWIQVMYAPASENTNGWAVDVKWRLLRVGVERNSRYDFTDRDNLIFTLGLEKVLLRGQ